MPEPGILLSTWTGDETCNLGTCPDRESNLHPTGYRMTLQPTEPRRPGLHRTVSTTRGSNRAAAGKLKTFLLPVFISHCILLICSLPLPNTCLHSFSSSAKTQSTNQWNYCVVGDLWLLQLLPPPPPHPTPAAPAAETAFPGVCP